MPRYVYDAAQVRILQHEGEVVPAAEVDWGEETGVLSEDPVEGFAIVPADKTAINSNPPFRTEEEAAIELREIREWPEPNDDEAADEIPWPQPSV